MQYLFTFFKYYGILTQKIASCDIKERVIDMKRNVKLNSPERFSKPYAIDREKLLSAAKAACKKFKERVERDGPLFPVGTCSKDLRYQPLGKNGNWVSGMYTGCFFLAYELTGDEFFKSVAMNIHLPTYTERFENKVGLDDHDVGFVYMPGCVPAYKLFGDEGAKKCALDTFDYYFNTSYSNEGKFIIRQHTGYRRGGEYAYRTMMDSMMNASFFFWAGDVTGNAEYTKAGEDHALTTEKYLIREDGSSFHHYQFDLKTHKALYGLTFQGRADGSCWSRGQAWGVYGFPIAYSYTKNPVFKEVHKNITYFMLNHLPADMIPYWDYDFTSGDEPRDSSAGAISVCGLLEMAKHLDDNDADKVIFESAAAQMLDAIIDKCTNNPENYDGLINLVTHARPQNQGIDECAPYGDYFYLEALLRYLKPDFIRYW